MKLSKHIAIGVIAVSGVVIFNTVKVEATTAVVDVQSLYLREKASTSSDMVDGLVKGQKLEVIEKLDGWYKVEADGKIGYVSADFVTVKDENKEETKSTEKQETKQEETKPEEKNEEKTASEEKETKQEDEIKQEEKNTENSENNKEEKQESSKNTKSEVKEFKVKQATLENDAKAYILPLINSNVLKELKKGTQVTIYDETNNWYYIQDDEISAWVNKTVFGEIIEQEENTKTEETKSIEEKETKQEETKSEEKNEEKTASEEKEITKKSMYVNNTGGINVREGAGTDYKVVTSLSFNDMVYVIAEVGDWYKVEVNEGVGYIAKRLLSEKEQDTTSRGAEERTVESDEQNQVEEQRSSASSASSVGEEIAEFAKQYLGCPYVYGASGPSSFDCSGFTMYVFKNFGINLSHSATAQSKNGDYIAKEDLMPGDLVFFKDYQTMDGIGHVGIYVGDGNFIHASSGTGYCVKISTLLSGSYNTRYETARRLV